MFIFADDFENGLLFIKKIIIVWIIFAIVTV